MNNTRKGTKKMTDKINYRATFMGQFETWQSMDLFQKMKDTVEASPWHREANVLVHTQMVVAEYMKATDNISLDWTHEDYLGAVSTAFHDVGKPSSRIEKFSEARGKYFAYHGHEQVSARKFEEFAAGVRYPMFSAEDIFKICWMIEHHMPWEVVDKEKRRQMALTANMTVGAEVWVRALMSDQFGRIADDNDAKLAKAFEWADDFFELCATTGVLVPREFEQRRTMVLLIAPSGAGKSTYLNKLLTENPATNVFSLDRLRHEFYDANDYAKAYQASVDDKSFEARANAVFHKMSKDTKDLVVDNTNLSAKRRRFYIDVARRQDFRTVAVIMPTTPQVLLARQRTRGDKRVPDSAVLQHYSSVQMPMYGEFEEIVVLTHNLGLKG
jgi:predicted kinase